MAFKPARSTGCLGTTGDTTAAKNAYASKRFFFKCQKRIIFFSSGVSKWKKRGGWGEIGLIIIEEWREVNDDSFFKLVFDKNKKELKSGQLGRIKSFKNRERSR